MFLDTENRGGGEDPRPRREPFRRRMFGLSEAIVMLICDKSFRSNEFHKDYVIHLEQCPMGRETFYCTYGDTTKADLGNTRMVTLRVAGVFHSLTAQGPHHIPGHCVVGFFDGEDNLGELSYSTDHASTAVVEVMNFLENDILPETDAPKDL